MTEERRLDETTEAEDVSVDEETVVTPDPQEVGVEPDEVNTATGEEALDETEEPDEPRPEEGSGGENDQVPPINQLYQVYLAGSEEQDRPFLVPVLPAEVKRIFEVFVAPTGFSGWLDRRSDTGRVFVVYGHDHSGKLATAIKVGLECAGDAAEFLKFQRPGPGSPSLDRYLWSDYAEARSSGGKKIVYLATDFLSEGLTTVQDLAALSDLEARLDKINSFLVLTSETPEMAMRELLCDKLSAENVDLGAVFSSHLKYYAKGGESAELFPEVVQEAEKCWSNLSSRFRFPIQIRGFCRLLAELGPQAGQEEITKAASKAAAIGRLRVREWFRGLDDNQRLFSLLVYLFQGIDRQDLDEIYVAAVNRLRATGIPGFADPRTVGYEDLLESIHARVETTEVPDAESLRPLLASSGERSSEPLSDEEEPDLDAEEEDSPSENETDTGSETAGNGAAATESEADEGEDVEEDDKEEKAEDSGWLGRQQVVVFAERAVEEEVQRQVHNYPDLLWSLHDLFTELAGRRGGHDAALYHKALGAAIARFGATRQRRMIELLKDLVRSDSHGVQAVAGAALGEALANDPGFRQQGLQELAKWTQHAHPSWTFAASFAIWRAYYGVVEAAISRHGAGLEDKSVKEVLAELLHLIDQMVREVNRRRRKRRALARGIAQRVSGNRHQQNRAERELIEKWARGDLLGAVIALKMIARFNPAAAAEMVSAWLVDGLGKRMSPVETHLRLGPAGQWVEIEARVDVASALTLFEEATERKPLPEMVEPLQRLLLPLLETHDLNHDWLIVVMRTLSRWHQWPDIREISFQDLLRIANRCRDESAWRFGLAIVRFWLDTQDPSSTTTRLGETLLARLVAMEGSPVELPGDELGLILLDSSEPRIYAHLCEVTRRLLWLLRSQIDIEVRALGDVEVLANRASTLLRQSLLVNPRPRLLVPAVEASETTPAFVLALAAAEIIDTADALGSDWADRLTVAYLTPEAIDLPKESASSFVRLDPQRPEALLEILDLVLRRRYWAFSQPSSEETTERVTRYLELQEEGSDEAWSALERRISQLDEVDRDSGAHDSLRWILGTVRWLAEVDFEQCVTRLRAWLGNEDLLARQVAAGSSRMLFKMIIDGEWRPSAGTHGSLFSLAGPLAEESWSGAQVALTAAAKLADLPAWRKVLMGESEHGIPCWLERVAPVYRREIHQLAGEWQQSSDEGKQVSPVLLAMAERIQRIAARAGCDLLETDDEEAYVVLVLDADCNPTRIRRRLGQVAAGILNKAPAEFGNWLVCRLGHASPLPRVEGKANPGQLAPAGAGRPRLLMPLLESLPERAVRHVLALSTGPILDEQDLVGSAWLDKVSCYHLDNRWRDSALLRQVPSFREPETVPSILRYLAQLSPTKTGTAVSAGHGAETEVWK